MTCPVCQLPVASPVQLDAPTQSSRECPFCSAVFSRVDGAKRHAKSCPQRAGRELPSGRRGRRAKSCTQCSRIRVYCSAPDQGPCERCLSRKLDCTFTRRCCTDVTHRQSSHSGIPNHDTHGKIPLEFILNFTDTKQDFFTERAVGEEPDGDLLGPMGHSPQQDEALNDHTLDYIDPTLLLPCDSDTWLDNMHNTEEQGLLGAFLSPLPAPDRLSARLDLLESHLAAHADSRSILFNHQLFRQFFSLSNVNMFAMTFCRKRHYQFTLIHWPTFSLDEASLPLLIAVALTGATYSFDPENGPQHIGPARNFYQLADSYVFHQLKTYADYDPASVDVKEAIETFQAGLLMYGINELQRGNSAVHFTTTSERLPALVSAMRRLHFIDCRHDPLEDWPLFLQREHIIRLVSWTYCADCLATLTYNKPPIFSLLEMTGDLPCDPALWDGEPNLALDAMKSFQRGTSYSIKNLTIQLVEGTARIDDEWDSIPLFHLQAILCGEFPSKPKCGTKSLLSGC